ncbi:threonine aldolase [Coleophoma cylindrospora]|uniref:Threonine aldolase n=1 Tax=Coleophoma cylindrospora TaxID=1849047 RepID=A0A3D8SFD5_9HELO|nr:threonine aldolase [Coleophoma cylindrospora]
MATYSFRDDYSDGAHPDIIAAIGRANTPNQMPYGEDSYSTNAKKLIKEKMNAPGAEIYFVTSGTLANIIAIGSCLRSYEAVIAASSGHIVVRETGAIEAIGQKIINVEPVHGKLTPAGILKALGDNLHFPHMAKPRLVYISNTTEVGTVYSKTELETIAQLCRAHGLLLFLDGARLGVALAAEQNDLTLEDYGRLTDMFWIGGTKVGALMGEAIVINNPTLQEDFRFHIKQRGGLLAKGGILGSQFEELFRGDLYYTLASHANMMAKALSDGLQKAGFRLTERTASNQVFAILPNPLIKRLQADFAFYIWNTLDGKQSVVRLITSWSTELKQVQAFIKMLQS